MMNETGITGTLEDWWYDNTNHVIWGYVFGDSKERFKDGTYIHTSSLKIPKKLGALKDALNEGSVVNTRNSSYRLGKVQKTE